MGRRPKIDPNRKKGVKMAKNGVFLPKKGQFWSKKGQKWPFLRGQFTWAPLVKGAKI